MKDEHQGAIIAGGLGLGVLAGIVLSFVLKSSPHIGDCGVNVEINKFYLYLGLFATKVFFTIACGFGGIVAGIVVLGICEAYIRIKDSIQNIGKSNTIQIHVHRKYNYRYFINTLMDVLEEAYFVLLAWAIGIALYVLALQMSPEICYISDKTRADFILSTGLTVSVFSLIAGAVIHMLAKHFNTEILKYILGTLDECKDLDSVVCKCDIPELESLFDNDIYTVHADQGRVTYTSKDGSCHSVDFKLYNWSFSPQYNVRICNLDGIVRGDNYHGYTLRQVVAHTIKVCEKYQKKA